MTDNKLTIYVTYHQDSQVNDYHLNTLTTPFKLYNVNDTPQCININHLNFTFSEMVTMYYVYKNNIYTPYIGFNHYRRIFKTIKLPDQQSCQIYKIYHFNIYRQYVNSHNQQDIDIALSILDNIYGTDNPYSKHIRHDNTLIGNCCFIMTWDNFTKLCDFLFPILFKFDEQIQCNLDKNNYIKRYKGDTYQARTVSFIAERLISAYITTHLNYYL